MANCLTDMRFNRESLKQVTHETQGVGWRADRPTLVQPRLQPQSNSALYKTLSIMQIDHTNYPKRLKGLDSEALRFIIKDCREAINALPDNPKNGYYADEINYCVMELHRRKNK